MVPSEGEPGNNLPLPLSSFVGREAELGEVRETLHRERLLTLTGFGGCGKSRLALETAWSIIAEERRSNGFGGAFADGVWLVELASLRDPRLVARETASVLGVGERSRGELDRELAAVLKYERCLILLDNCEHLIEACAHLAEGLLKQCPGLAVLATSREPLGATGEMVWPVRALSVPDSTSLEAVSRCESARLFTERAASASPGFGLTEDNAPAVAEVCRRLDGIPLAIELAASRARSMTTTQISARLDDALGLLASGPRTAPERQSTLRATIDWSYNLLSSQEQALLRALAVFSGGFKLGAAEKVCAEEAGGDRVPVLDILSRLVDKSLIQVRRSGEEVRYHLQEVIYQYATEKLEEAGEGRTLRRTHAIFFRDFAEEAEPGLIEGPDMELWLRLVDEDLDNFRAAMTWAANVSDAELALRLSCALAWFWLRQGRLAEGRTFVEGALAIGPGTPVPTAKALHVSGGLAWAQGDLKAADPLLRESVARFRELDHYEWRDAWLSSALSAYSFERLDRGEIEEALDLAEESIVIGRRFGESQGLARGMAVLGLARMATGDFEGARTPLEESAAICRRLEDGWLLSYPLGSLAAMALWAGDHEKARSLAEEGVRVLEGLGDRWLLANSLAFLAVTLAARGRARRAAALFGASEAMRNAVGQEEVYAHYRAVYEEGVHTVRRSLGEEEFADVWAGGRTMSTEEAISLALEEDEPAGEPSVQPLRILALGQVHVEVGGKVVRVSDWKYAKVAELFFYLISNPPATREKIGLELWPEASSSQLRNAFHSAMHRLRRALGSTRWIRYSGGRYAFDHTIPHSFDARDFEDKTRQARRCAREDPKAAVKLLEDAAEGYQGDFLEGFPGGDWIFSRQQELRELHLEGQLLLGRLQSESGKHSEAARAYRRAITCDPYSAQAHDGLIRAYSNLGERGRAIRHYKEYEDTLQRDLDAPPPSEVTDLVKRLRDNRGPN